MSHRAMTPRAGLRLARLVAALLVWLTLAVAPVAAQTDADYATWDGFAKQVEQTLDDDDASDAVLQQMRSTVVDWRRRFDTGQKATTTRLTTLRDQIAALGAPPAEGATEPDDIAARRAQLGQELAAEQAPILRASEAWGRADGLVAEIDRSLRERQTSQLLTISPSPLLPSSVEAMLRDGETLAVGVSDELTGRSGALGQRGLIQRLPAVLGLIAAAVLLVMAGRRWVARLPTALLRLTRGHAVGAIGLLVSMAELLLPLIGFWLVLLAIEATGLVGPWLRPFLEAAALAALTYNAGLWIARRLFPGDPALPALGQLVAPRRGQVRRNAELLAAMLALHQLVTRPLLPLSGMNLDSRPAVMVPSIFSDAGAGVVHLALIVLAAIPLYRLGHLLRNTGTRDNPGSADRLLATVGSLMRVVAVAAPVAAAAGYVTAANAVIWPTVMTLALIGLVILVQRFLTALWQMVRGRPERGTGAPAGAVAAAGTPAEAGEGAASQGSGGGDSLAPIVIAFLLCLLALPQLALIWGARTSDLVEVWTRLSNGFRVGSIRLSPGGILTFILVFTLGYTLTRGAQRTLRTSVLPRTRIDGGGQNAIVAGLGYVGIFLAAILAITSAGIDLSSLAIVAGALSVGIGFGMQNIVSNFVSGIILLIERPVTVGDWVQVGTAQGFVRRISVRSTTIQTFDRTEVVVPNSDLITQQVTNWTRGSLTGRIVVPVSVAYGTDTRKVAALLVEIAEDQPTVLIDPSPAAFFTGFGADGLEFELRAILSDINQGASVSTEIRHQIAERMKDGGIEMPFSQRDIWLRNPDALAQAVAMGERVARDRLEKAPAKDDAALFDPHIAHATASGLERPSPRQGREDEDDGDSDHEGDDTT